MVYFSESACRPAGFTGQTSTTRTSGSRCTVHVSWYEGLAEVLWLDLDGRENQGCDGGTPLQEGKEGSIGGKLFMYSIHILHHVYLS